MKQNESILLKLDKVLSYIDQHKGLYVNNPGKDFSRNRILTFIKELRIMLSMEGGSLNKELAKHFKLEETIVTKSAFIQQREKLKPIVFYDILRLLDEINECIETYKGYRLLAVDGSCFNISKNVNSPAAVFNKETKQYLCTQLHLNASYDLLNHRYIDAYIQPQGLVDENHALWEIMERQPASIGKAIYVADRGYESYNTLAHFIESKNADIVLRVKQDRSAMRLIRDLPMTELDVDIDETISNKQTNEAKNKKYIVIHTGSIKGKEQSKKTIVQRFDFPLPYRMKLRAVRFLLPTGEYETLLTTLPRNQFSIDDMKELYRQRWGIEVSFCKLKYACNAVSFHSKSMEASFMELYASLIRYNICESVVAEVAIEQKEENVHQYQVNFMMAVPFIIDFIRKQSNQIHELYKRIATYIEPVRPGRRDTRKTVVPKTFIVFTYRRAA